MNVIAQKSGGIDVLLQGNQAIARGALEGGAIFCAGYPGNPSSEIIENLSDAAKDLPIYVEWSVNEKVALECATAASFAGCRAIVAMKQNGVNVVSDFLTNLSLSGTKGGLALITCDDPSGISSTNEEDARHFSKLAEIPLLEPATPQEALEMTRWVFTLSEDIKNICMIRSVSRLSHTRSNVMLGDLPSFKSDAYFDLTKPFHTFPVVAKHKERYKKLKKTKEIFEKSPFNKYHGPTKPELIIIVSGCALIYVEEAVSILGLNEKVGILKFGTTWPLPTNMLKKYLLLCNRFLFVEDIDPFLETNVKSFASDLGKQIGVKEFIGKDSGDIPISGETSPGLIMDVLGRMFNIKWRDDKYRENVFQLTDGSIPQRELGFCPGCPHRASYHAIKTALAWDGRDGFVSGDIGCYTMGIWPTGFNMVKSVHAMGSGVGLANGYGKLDMFGFNQPVITVCGDSTFFHAALPALINSRFNRADILLVILDNSATAMTGFQPHPGTGTTAMEKPTEPVDIEALCGSLDVLVEVADPYDLTTTSETLYRLLQLKGKTKVLIMRRKCALIQGREGGYPFRMKVDEDRCIGEECGCNRYCTRIFRCPGLIWNEEKGKAMVDEVACVGCGICADICPQGAIEREELQCL